MFVDIQVLSNIIKVGVQTGKCLVTKMLDCKTIPTWIGLTTTNCTNHWLTYTKINL